MVQVIEGKIIEIIWRETKITLSKQEAQVIKGSSLLREKLTGP